MKAEASGEVYTTSDVQLVYLLHRVKVHGAVTSRFIGF